MLHREYFPFMPTGLSAPRGPIDPPTLEGESPEGWWEASAFELFGAAENIACLLHDASECGAEIISPFVGFCAFSAAYMNLYVFRFPQMNLGRSRNAERNIQYCMTYLESFRQVWKLGDSWVSGETALRSLHAHSSPFILEMDRWLTGIWQSNSSRLSKMHRYCTSEPRQIGLDIKGNHGQISMFCTNRFTNFELLIDLISISKKLKARSERRFQFQHLRRMLVLIRWTWICRSTIFLLKSAHMLMSRECGHIGGARWMTSICLYFKIKRIRCRQFWDLSPGIIKKYLAFIVNLPFPHSVYSVLMAHIHLFRLIAVKIPVAALHCPI